MTTDEHYGVDMLREDFDTRNIANALAALGKKMGWDMSLVIRGDVLSIEAKRDFTFTSMS